MFSCFQVLKSWKNRKTGKQNWKTGKHFILLENTSRTNLYQVLVHLKACAKVLMYSCFPVFPHGRVKSWKNWKTGKQENIYFRSKIILKFILILFYAFLTIFEKLNVFLFSSFEIVEKQENRKTKLENRKTSYFTRKYTKN